MSRKKSEAAKRATRRKAHRRYVKKNREWYRKYFREYERKRRVREREKLKAYHVRYQYSGRKKQSIERCKARRLKKQYGAQHIFEKDGETYYAIKSAADYLPIAAWTVRAYMHRGVIPRPVYRRFNPSANIHHQVGYLSWTQIELLRKAFRKKRKDKSLETARKYLHDNWTRYEKNFRDPSQNGGNGERRN